MHSSQRSSRTCKLGNATSQLSSASSARLTGHVVLLLTHARGNSFSPILSHALWVTSVFHLCAAIRFWERSSFTYRLSAAVNIDGTKHVLDALRSLPDSSSDKTLVFCSSAAVQLYEPLFMRLGWNYRSGYPSSWTLTDDREIPDKDLASHCYAVTKAIADRLVREANGVQGVTTGVVSAHRAQSPDCTS